MLAANMDYKVFTSKHDREVAAEHLATAIGHLSARATRAVNDAWEESKADMLSWRNKVHLLAAESATRIRAALSKEQRQDTIVVLLFDQSGSMRGQKMLFAAATADVVQEHLLTLKIACEILGFTTVRWRGGKSRLRWNLQLRPKNPGRLNDLLHIIYKNADDVRASTGGHWIKQMLRPDLPKENIDGEAIEWASRRLRERPERNKFLIVLSDGAPVDDSTLSANTPGILEDHVRLVINQIDRGNEMKIGGVGIGFDVSRYYPISTYTEAPGDLGELVIRFVERLLTSDEPPAVNETLTA
jgi:cobaltochelatase CobT